MIKTLLTLGTLGCLAATRAMAITSDADTTLLLHFENSPTGAAGEAPVTNSGVPYAAGVVGQGVQLNSGEQLYYPVAGNFDPTRGTLECWIKPNWAGNDGLSHVILRHGGGGGVLILKDGANNLRAIFNRFSANGQPEVGVAYNIGAWTAGSWHHVAFTWGDGALRLYTDGALRTQTTVGALPPVADTSFQIGADGTGSYAEALLDELRISNRPRTAAEIASAFAADIPGVTAIAVTPASTTIWPTWTLTPTVQATTALGSLTVPPAAVTWVNPAPAVAQVDAGGRVVGVAGGTAALTAQFRGYIRRHSPSPCARPSMPRRNCPSHPSSRRRCRTRSTTCRWW